MLSRRSSLLMSLVLPFAMMLSTAASAEAPARPYVDLEVVKAAQADGKTILVDFKADWCGTCQAQARVIDEILTERPEVGEKIEILNLNWDVYGEDDFTKGLNVPRRSTLILFKGTEEAGRLVAATSREDIEGLLNQGL